MSSGKGDRYGFTLIELSIVLVIIGLITGSALAGRTLIRQAEFQSVGTDLNRFKTATYAFHNQYGGWPGDIKNATSFWGAAGGNSTDNFTASCYATVGAGMSTCNGDGNGLVAGSTQLPLGDTSVAPESFRFWQHLANAGLLSGTYTGVAGSQTAWQGIPGINLPKGRITNSGYAVQWYGTRGYVPAENWLFPLNYGHLFIFGLTDNTFGFGPALPALTPSEAAALDSKYDDGMPGSGFMVMQKAAEQTPNCIVSAQSYNIQYPAPACDLLDINVF